ncbi:MAG: ABC transporter ATP-binding protein [Thermodesulfobacteriota bacterium]|nr:ABC transporter ATP-binding protein [Thermodesulfobacteriota bacterium]
MIQLLNLSKKYGEFTAVDCVNLEISQGEIFGFLGPNGAGKTTTIRMTAGLLNPTSGRIILDNKDMVTSPIEAKRLIGLIPDRPFLYDKLSGIEFLRFIASLYGLKKEETEKRIEKFFDIFELTGWEEELIESYSHGMRQKLIISSALIHQPKVIIVDEPMVGLDPKGARMVKEIFKELCMQSGVTVFMSTHTLEIAEEMCHRIAIIQGGKVIAIGTPEELRELAGCFNGGLDSIFLKLTGGEGMKEIIEILRM